ncbi:unnamed protein product, partial [Pleuronectes platessa]
DFFKKEKPPSLPLRTSELRFQLEPDGNQQSDFTETPLLSYSEHETECRQPTVQRPSCETLKEMYAALEEGKQELKKNLCHINSRHISSRAEAVEPILESCDEAFEQSVKTRRHEKQLTEGWSESAEVETVSEVKPAAGEASPVGGINFNHNQSIRMEADALRKRGNRRRDETER